MSDAIGGMKVLVTGGRGFIGRHVVTALRTRGADPIAIAHPSLDGDATGVVRLDLDDGEAFAAAAVGMDAIVHLAARSGGIQFQEAGDVFEANRRMTDTVLAAAVSAGVGRVFLASSLVVYRGSDTPLVESDPLVAPGDAGATPYALSKVEDEAAGRSATDTEVVIGRFGNVYGPGGSFDPSRATVVHSLIDRAATASGSLPVWGDGTAVRSFVFVEDVAGAVVHVLGHGRAGAAYNVDTGVPVTIEELATTIRDVVDPSLELEFDVSKPTGHPHRVGSIDALVEIGYRPSVGLVEGLDRTVAWYRSRSD